MRKRHITKSVITVALALAVLAGSGRDAAATENAIHVLPAGLVVAEDGVADVPDADVLDTDAYCEMLDDAYADFLDEDYASDSGYESGDNCSEDEATEYIEADDGDIEIAEMPDDVVITEDELSEDAAAGTPKMTIYGINLGNGDGDSTLIECDGEYLLMDIGNYVAYPYLKAALDRIGVKKLSLYISHFHSDHTGGLSAMSTGGNCGYDTLLHDFDVVKVYLPSKDLVTEIDHSTRYAKFEKLYNLRGYEGRNSGNSIKYLKKGSSFNVGSAKVDIIGPVDYSGLTLEYFMSTESKPEFAENKYVNNRSLVAKITCGDRTFLTCGDCCVEEEAKLIEKYGSSLKADIYKLNHHGLSTSNSQEFLNIVKPQFSYGLNSAEGARMMPGGGWVTKNARTIASRYGFVYMVGDEQNTCRYDVGSENIRVYTARDDFAAPLTGMVKVYGSSGFYYPKYDFKDLYDYYCLDENGVPLKGVQTVGGKRYYFGTGGCMARGGFNADGDYLPAVYTFNDDFSLSIRYFLMDGTMQTGVVKHEGIFFYFGKDGRMVTGKTVKVNGRKYTVDPYGQMWVENPSQAVIKTLSSKKGKLTAKWEKSQYADGYEIYISDAKKGKYSKKAVIKDQKTLTKSIGKLKKGKKYFVKVRAYRKVGSYTVYGKFSKIKSVKIR